MNEEGGLTVERRSLLKWMALVALCPRPGRSLPDLSKLFGKIQWVESFPDFKVQVVHSFPDLKVELVTSFPDKVGKWQIVDSFPDFKIQKVDSFPDFKIQFVESFPGIP